MTFLGFDRQGGDGPCLQPFQANGLSGITAKAIGPFFDPVQGGVNFSHQFTLSVAGAQLDGPFRFRRGPVSYIRGLPVIIL